MIYKLGSKGPEVRAIQQQLAVFLKVSILPDGIFGRDTKNAVIKFQLLNMLNADGIVGESTWNALFPKNPMQDKAIISTPIGQKMWMQIYGDPLHDADFRTKIQFCDLSDSISTLEHVVLGWIKNKKAFVTSSGFGFYCHKLCIPHFQAAFKAITAANLGHEIKTFDGCWNVRKVRGSTALSPHSWGMAIDLNAYENQLGNKKYKMSPKIVEIFESLQFEWGGRWRRCDAMHFQFARY